MKLRYGYYNGYSYVVKVHERYMEFLSEEEYIEFKKENGYE